MILMPVALLLLLTMVGREMSKGKKFDHFRQKLTVILSHLTVMLVVACRATADKGKDGKESNQDG
jgi:hypothetical protein